MFNISYFELQKYCDCADEFSQTNADDLFSDFYAANCSITTEAILCSEKTTFQSFTSTCRQYQNRYKRDVNEMDFEHQIEKRSVDSDDIIEVAPLTIDPNFDPNVIPPVHNYIHKIYTYLDFIIDNIEKESIVMRIYTFFVIFQYHRMIH